MPGAASIPEPHRGQRRFQKPNDQGFRNLKDQGLLQIRSPEWMEIYSNRYEDNFFKWINERECIRGSIAQFFVNETLKKKSVNLSNPYMDENKHEELGMKILLIIFWN